MTFMQHVNYKCQPAALYLDQLINVLTWMMLVEECSGLYGLNLNIQCTGTKGARILKYSFDVTNPPNVNASATHWGLGAICYLPPPGKLSNPKCQKNVSKKVSQKVSKKCVPKKCQ